MEHGISNNKTALEEISEKYNIKASAIVTMDEVVSYVKENYDYIDDDTSKRLNDYYSKYAPKY